MGSAYDPATDKWAPKALPGTARTAGTVAIIDENYARCAGTPQGLLDVTRAPILITWGARSRQAVNMLIRRQTLDLIRTGTIDLAYRRWKRPTVKAGGRLRTAVGELAIESVDSVTLKSITERDARRAGFGSRAQLLAELRARKGKVYRIRLRFSGPDSRVALREEVRLSAADVERLETRLARMDARGKDGPWTAAILASIRAHPARRAPDLALALGMERDLFKRRVRRLKELGLTRSLEVGYELSPRGIRFLA